MLVDTADIKLTGKGATELVCHLDDVLQHAGRQALRQAGAVVRQVRCKAWEEWGDSLVWVGSCFSTQVCKYENNSNFLTIFSRQESQPWTSASHAGQPSCSRLRPPSQLGAWWWTWIFVFLCIVWLWSVNKMLQEFTWNKMQLPYPLGVYVNSAMVFKSVLNVLECLFYWYTIIWKLVKYLKHVCVVFLYSKTRRVFCGARTTWPLSSYKNCAMPES